jgi:hypothetical protein
MDLRGSNGKVGNVHSEEFRPNVTGTMKSCRMRWAGYVARIRKMRN